MAISLPCTKLYKPFDSMPVGFTGDYNTEVKDKCPTCPEDDLFFKEAQMNYDGDLVCNRAPGDAILDATQISSLRAPGVTYTLKTLIKVSKPLPIAPSSVYSLQPLTYGYRP